MGASRWTSEPPATRSAARMARAGRRRHRRRCSAAIRGRQWARDGPVRSRCFDLGTDQQVIKLAYRGAPDLGPGDDGVSRRRTRSPSRNVSPCTLTHRPPRFASSSSSVYPGDAPGRTPPVRPRRPLQGAAPARPSAAHHHRVGLPSRGRRPSARNRGQRLDPSRVWPAFAAWRHANGRRARLRRELTRDEAFRWRGTHEIRGPDRFDAVELFGRDRFKFTERLSGGSARALPAPSAPTRLPVAHRQ
jgi:hypothetical protein